MNTHTPAAWDRIKAVVGEAAPLPPDERAALIEQRCAGDHLLRAEVLSLLAAGDSSQALIHAAADSWVGAAPDLPELPDAGRLGAYLIERVIAQSPGAVVYAARQETPDRAVALKVLRAALPLTSADERFWLEAYAAARVEHPNVVRVYEVGFLKLPPRHRLPYIAMELVQGKPITDYARENHLDQRQQVQLLRRVALAVARIHQCGVIHRDLKPTNVLVDADGEPKVLDFGIARLTAGPHSAARTLHGQLLGTPGYISPEQINSPADVDVRTDVWSLGVLAYELLSGVSPFLTPGATPLESIHAASHDAAPPLKRVAPHVDPDLARVVHKAMARDRDHRYDSASDLATDLDNLLHTRPVSARPATLRYRAATLARRRALPLTLAAIALLLAASFAAAQVRAWRRAAVERDRAEAVISVIRAMITSADPNFGHRDARMRDVLHALETSLPESLSDEPLTDADLRSLLASMHFGLGDYDHARALLEQALALRDRAGAHSSPQAFADRAALVQALRWLYLTNDALDLASRITADAARILGPTHPATLDAREALAGCFHDLDRLDDAVREYRAVLTARLAIHPESHDAPLRTRSELASVLSDAARYHDAERELREILRLRPAPSHALDTLTVRANLARVLAEQGRLDDAVLLLRATDRDAREALGPDHPTSITARNNLIEFVRRQSDELEALRLADELLDACISRHGWAHDLTLNTFVGYATSLVRAGRADEALQLSERALEQTRNVLSDDSPWLARLHATLAAATAGSGRPADSIPIYRDAIERLSTSLGPDHRATLTARSNMALAMIDTRDSSSAVRVLHDALRAADEAGYLEMQPVLRRNLGRALLESDDHSAGVQELISAYHLSVARQEHANAITCARLLAEHFERAQSPTDAELWRARAAPGGDPGR